MSEMASAWRHRSAGTGGRRRIDRASEPVPEPPPRLRISRGGWAFLLAMLGSAVIWAVLIVAIVALVHHR